MVDTEATVCKRQRFREERNQQAEQRAQVLDGKVGQLQCQYDMWSEILLSITGVDSHGTKEPSGMTWQDYFQQSLGKELADLPPSFMTAELPFTAALLKVSEQVGALQLELSKYQGLEARARERAEKRKRCNAKREQRAEKKVREFCDDTHDASTREASLNLVLKIQQGF